MMLYVYGDGYGNYYRGRSPTGRVRYTNDCTCATFFSEVDKDDAEDCIELGLNLYVLEVSEPILVTEGSVSTATPGVPERSFSDWAVHPLDLSGPKSN